MKLEKWKIGQSKLIPRLTTAKGEEASDSCKRHPSLDLDTICFHLACRQDHNQIICSYCGQESQQHRQHIEQQFPIYRTSPGFRLVSNYPAESDDLVLAPNLDESNKVIEEIKTLFQSQMQQILGQSLLKMKCLGEFLNKNGIFRICNKIRHSNAEHQDCCLRMINKLKDIEATGSISEKDYELVIHKEIQSAKQLAKHQAQYIKSEISKIFAKIRGEIKAEDGPQRSNAEDDITKTQERSNSFSSSIINQLLNMSEPVESKLRKQKMAINEEPLPQIKEKNHPLQSQSAMITKKNQNKLPKGVEQLNANTIRIWNGNTKKYYEIFKFLSAQTQISHLIIENQNLTSNNYINTILSKMNWLQGLHVHCKSKFHFRLPPNCRLQYFSFLPTYRFIRLVDRCQYFSNTQAKSIDEQAKGNMEMFADDVCFKNMYIYKNNHAYVPQYIEELHFFRSQHDLPWTLRKQVLMKLDFPGSLFVLAFNNIIFSETVCLKPIFERCCRLHTLVFKNIEGRYNKIMKQLRYLKVFQLCHLQISGNQSEKKISLQPYSYKEIFHNRALETLILTNVEFLDERRKLAKNSLVLKEISKLKFLTHLNLYSSEPVYNDLLEYIPNESYQNMEMLNLGLTQITPEATKNISRFRKLESLCIDYSGLRDSELLQITKEMRQLRHLSIENLRVSPQFFTSMNFKCLKNVNIYGCENLREYRWENFSELECLRINKGLISFDLFYYLRARAIAINIQEADQVQDQTRSFSSNNNPNCYDAIDEESAQSESDNMAELQTDQRKQRLLQNDVAPRMEESYVTACMMRSKKRKLEKHESTEEAISNHLANIFNSKVEVVGIDTEYGKKGSTVCLFEEESD